MTPIMWKLYHKKAKATMENKSERQHRIRLSDSPTHETPAC